jgi:6-phosphogluconate dehydrogenase
MQLGYIGLGKMGKNMVLRLLERGYEVVVWNRSKDKVAEVVGAGAKEAETIEELVQMLEPPRTIWIMLTAGDVTEEMLFGGYNLVSYLDAGDTVIDGGNSRFTDSRKRAEICLEQSINFLDAGVSGGPNGARNGACLMVGGETEVVKKYEKLFTDLATKDGYLHVGPAGSGHFVKMVHNAIEYGMMQAIGEGYELLANGPYEGLKLDQLSELWQHGSVIESKLVGLLSGAFGKDARLEKISGYVEDNGETQWAIETALQHKVPMSAIAHALFARYSSRQEDSFAMRVVAALRKEFGGHVVKENS